MNHWKRWWIALAGILLQMALGAVYAWSVFRVPLAKQFHWSISQVTLTFTIAIMMLGFASFFGGLWLKRVGPRVVALTGGALYGAGVFLASFSYHGLWWLYLTYGVIGGIGLGFAYIVPISVLVKWFPDRRGLMTGIAVGGFGAGALVTAPLATKLIQSVGVLQTFAYLGIAFLIVSVAAGISIISQEAPMFQEFAKVTAIVAAGMVGVVSIGNALGRVFWAWISDTIGRRMTFAIMFILQIALFWFLPSLHSVGAVTVVGFIILMCYGGGFGTMPAFAADYFGSANVGSIYGLILTAWGFASAFGPLLIAHMRQSTGTYSSGLHIIALIMALSVVLPLLVRPPAPQA